MQKLIAGYLFQYKRSALPHIGTLEIRQKEAVQVPGEKKITAPVPEIIFTEQQHDPAGLVDYIAANKLISREEAAYLLNKCCEVMLALPANEEMEIPGAGKFKKNGAGKLFFIPVAVPAAFFPDVAAERVIHLDSSHAMLVGDKETSTAAMTEYYTGPETIKKSRRYLWFALILLLLSAAVFAFYLNDDNRNAYFGISHQYEPLSAGSTYQGITLGAHSHFNIYFCFLIFTDGHLHALPRMQQQ